MIRRLGFFASLACAAILTACGTTEDQLARDEFADAEAVLTAEEEILADPILAAEAVVLPPAFENPEWAQAGGEADHAPVHVSAPEFLQRLWRATVVSSKSKKAPQTSPPVVGPERLYVIDAVASVAAFDKSNGRQVWRTRMTPDVTDPQASRFNIFARVHPADLGFGGGAALEGDRLFVTSGFGFVAALDPETGEVLWKYDGPGPMRNPPLVAEGVVVAVSISNEVVALDQQTGEEVWTYQSFEESARFLAAAAPAYADETVIIPFSSGEVASLNITNGRVQWQAVISRTSRLNALSVLGDIAGSPIIDRGAVFSVSQSGQMAGIDLRTGQVAWETPVGGYHTPWLSGESIFVISNRGELTALNRVDGRVRWKQTLPGFENEKKRKGRIAWAGPVLAGGRLWIVGTNGELRGLSPQNGEVMQTFKLRQGATLTPIVAANVIYILGEDGAVEAWGAAPLPDDYTG